MPQAALHVVQEAEMNRQTGGPKWWALFMILLGFAVTLAVESLLPVQPISHQIVLIIAVLAFYGLMMTWIFANLEALQDEEDLRRDANVRGREMPVTERQATYRLALIRRNIQLQSQNDGDDSPDPRWSSWY
jgi:hypothetical protein